MPRPTVKQQKNLRIKTIGTAFIASLAGQVDTSGQKLYSPKDLIWHKRILAAQLRGFRRTTLDEVITALQPKLNTDFDPENIYAVIGEFRKRNPRNHDKEMRRRKAPKQRNPRRPKPDERKEAAATVRPPISRGLR